MSTTKLNTKVVNASVKSPASEKPLSILQTPAEAKKPRKYENATVLSFDSKKEPGKVYIAFRAADGLVRTALAHPAIRWKGKLGKAIDLTVKVDCSPWRLLLKPTAEEEAAYAKASAPAPKAYSEVSISEADETFLASF